MSQWSNEKGKFVSVCFFEDLWEEELVNRYICFLDRGIFIILLNRVCGVLWSFYLHHTSISIHPPNYDFFLLQIYPQDKLPWTKFISIQNKLPLRTKFISIQKMKTQMETAKDNADGNSYRVSPQQWLQWWWQYSWLMVVCGLCDDNINSSPLCVSVSVKERWKETGGSS